MKRYLSLLMVLYSLGLAILRHKPRRRFLGVGIASLRAALLMLSCLAPCSIACADQWVAFFNHIHTNYNDEEFDWAAPLKLSVQQIMSRSDTFAKALGVPGAVAITEHNNWKPTADPAFRPFGVVQPIHGMEWAVELGEVTVFGRLDKQLSDSLKRGTNTAAMMKAFQQIHAQNGFLTACHPRSKVRWHTEKRLGVDAIEVWSGIGWKTWDSDALLWWNQLLTQGERITALGASDAHTYLHPIECPMNLVFAKSNKPDDMLAALRAGRVMVLGGPNMPQIFLAADTNGDGIYKDAMSGDALPVGQHGPVRLQVTIEKASPDDRLILTDRNGAFFNNAIGSGEGWQGNVYRFQRSFPEDQPNFVRAEIRQPDAKTMKSLCNPIYLPMKTAAGQ